MGIDVYHTELTSVKLNLFYAHVFALQHALERYAPAKGILEAVLPRHKQLEILLDRLIARDNVYLYGEEFDEQVHEELKR